MTKIEINISNNSWSYETPVTQGIDGSLERSKWTATGTCNPLRLSTLEDEFDGDIQMGFHEDLEQEILDEVEETIKNYPGCNCILIEREVE